MLLVDKIEGGQRCEAIEEKPTWGEVVAWKVISDKCAHANIKDPLYVWTLSENMHELALG